MFDILRIHQVLQLLVLQPAVAQQEDEPPSVKELLMDPYIIVAAGLWWLLDFLNNLHL